MSLLREGDVVRIYNITNTLYYPCIVTVTDEVHQLSEGPDFCRLWHNRYQIWSGCVAELLV